MIGSFGDRFVSRDRPMWHNLGETFTDPIDACTAVTRARMDYQFYKLPLLAEISAIANQYVQVSKFVVMREPTPDDDQWREFGVVDEDYVVLQNMRLAELVDYLTSGWPVETAGALNYGESTFFCLKTGREFEVPGDTSSIVNYFTAWDSKSGGSSLRMMLTPVRSECWNTLNMGWKKALVAVSLAHIAGMEQDLEWRIRTMKKLQETQNLTEASFIAMAKAILKKDAIEYIIENAYPKPGKPSKVEILEDFSAELDGFEGLRESMVESKGSWLQECARVEVLRQEAFASLERFNDEQPGVANTAWAVYQGVTFNEDHRKGPAETLAFSALFGDRARVKAKAFQLAHDAAL